MDSNPWQVESIDEFYFLKCPECMFFSQEENDFRGHAIENHPLSNTLFGNLDNEGMAEQEYESNLGEDLPSTSKNSRSIYDNLIDPSMIKEEFCEPEIEDNDGDLNCSEPNFAYFVSTNILEDDNPIVEENSEYLESSDEIDQEEKNEDVFAEVFKMKKRKRNDSNDQNDSEYTPKHKGNKLQQCKFCGKKVPRLNRHIRLVHEEKKRPHACNLCDKAFTQNVHLTQHIAEIHEKLKPHICDLCNASFGRKSHLMRHRGSAGCMRNISKNSS